MHFDQMKFNLFILMSNGIHFKLHFSNFFFIALYPIDSLFFNSIASHGK